LISGEVHFSKKIFKNFQSGFELFKVLSPYTDIIGRGLCEEKYGQPPDIGT
jgi:hypothetical protein